MRKYPWQALITAGVSFTIGTLAHAFIDAFLPHGAGDNLILTHGRRLLEGSWWARSGGISLVFWLAWQILTRGSLHFDIHFWSNSDRH